MEADLRVFTVRKVLFGQIVKDIFQSLSLMALEKWCNELEALKRIEKILGF
jgi:hypothetical protein